jgi:hypothetical protein
MQKACGNKCFLGPSNESCFPICAKGTCKIKTKGIYAAYVRAREYGSKKMHTKRSTSTAKRSTSTAKRSTSSTKRSTSKKHSHTKKIYRNIAARAKKMLEKRGFKVKPVSV